MFARLLPRGCSRLSIFVSYSHEQRMLGEEIAQALKNAGHEVFFDRDSIPASGDYNDRIRCAIQEADRFVFLASAEALAPGKFTLTELQFAKERWPTPEGKVLPVMIDRSVSIPDLPVYLRSVSVMSVEGSAPAEVVNAIDKTRSIGTLCRSVTLAAVAAALLAVAYVGLGLDKRGPLTDVVLVQPNKIHFRSLAEAPLRPEQKGGSTDWAASPLTVTVMPVAYTHRTEPGRRARILEETVDLVIAGASQTYRAIYIVEITDALCGDRWFCIKGNAGIETLEPGASIRRETMFVPVRSDATSWRSFVDTVLTSQDLTVAVTYRASVEVSEDAGPRRLDMRVDCRIDTREMRNEMEAAGFRAGANVKPVNLEPKCLPVSVAAK